MLSSCFLFCLVKWATYKSLLSLSPKEKGSLCFQKLGQFFL